MGHVLYSLGQVNDRTMKKYERDAQKIGKGSFAFAWVLDETGEERDRGITMDIAMNNFETDHRSFTLLDAPGHRDFIPNMISGAAQADAAILVVDASTGGFESGFVANGQTKEHALLARSLGVQQMIIAVNKLDTLDWDQGRYSEIVEKLGNFLTQAGFRKSNLSYVPVSGLTGENLIKKSELVPWYEGPCLIDLIDAFEPPVRQLDKPLRIGVTDFFKGGIGSSGGVSAGGTIDAGHVQMGEQLMVVPGGEIGVIKALQVNDDTATWGAAGDSVLMSLTGLDIMNLSSGCVLCNPLHPVPVTTSFTAQIVVFDLKVPITNGYPVILHHQSLDEPASIVKLNAVLDKSTGEVIKRNPRHLSKGMTAKVKIQLTNRAIPLETFKENKQLGRIMLRKGGETVAAGVVDEVRTNASVSQNGSCYYFGLTFS
ncbi:P-loop containing nucleoside triphosphate hydrolase protein [Zychaea mexicana]|uniref:P-loop containing nucleoside triphosphate hydrolase protein n=1 Tax=Zychaea mexicana TaxID=64656 RepID=UPI0022FE1C8B|nr:P-loop containing nucleoside triphosphate hydrolase protein [Zychaea mexicana]KAI9488306.1 P-loop containing nucleoside triphosphate hydrolase protein [Zychaea mexicana]